MENWKAIPGWENYEVSDFGRVRNVKFGRILKPFKNTKGYLTAGLSRNGEKKPFPIHQLVAIVFLDHVPNGNTITVDHVNGCKTDNRLENLELVTERENKHRGLAKKNNSSKFPGVCWYPMTKKWLSRIHLNGKTLKLGYFTSEEEAAQAYQTALEEFNRTHSDLDQDPDCRNKRD